MKQIETSKHTIKTLRHLGLAIAMASGLVAGTASAAPANDDFANAINLPGNTGTQTGTDIIAATVEVGEPSMAAALSFNTVWFQWTCPADGNFTVSTAGSTNATPAEFDAVLGIYSGVALNSLTALPGTPQDVFLLEAMTVPVTAGTSYYIQVGGYNNEAATNVLLNWSFAATIYQADILTFGPGALVGPVLSNAANITWNLTPGTNLATLTPTFTLSPGATCTIGGTPVASGDPVSFSGGPVVFTVTAQGASPIINAYTVTTVVGKVVLWDLAEGGDWDFSTSNWLGQVSGLPALYVDGDAVIFNKSEGGTINIPSTVTPFTTAVGAASGDYTFSGGSIAGAGSLTKEGSSTLTLAFANTYSGATVVNGGTLVANGNTTIGGSTSFTVADGALLRLSGATGGGYKWPAVPATLTGAGTVTVPAPGLFNTSFRFDMSAFTGVLNLTGGQFAMNPFYSPEFVSPTGGTINAGNGTALYLGWQGTTFNTTVRLSGGTDNGENLGVLRGDTATLNGSVILGTNSTIGSAGGTFTLNAVIGDEGNSFGFTKVGGGTVILTAATNTYTGPTVVHEGIMQCDTQGALGGGSLRINAKLNLNYVGTRTVAGLNLAGTAKVSGIYGSSASTAPPANQDDARFAGTGTVTVDNSGFTDWTIINAPGQTADQDHDNDGVKNGIEYFMGQSGSSFTAMPGLDGTNTVTWAMIPSYEGTYEVQTSSNLGTWTNVDPRPLPSGGNLSYLLPPGLGIQFVRLLVTPTP